jgi:hypothetical protein
MRYQKIGKNGNISKWNNNNKGKIEIEIMEIPKECTELSEELDELNYEIERGEGLTLTTDELAKKLGVDYQ